MQKKLAFTGHRPESLPFGENENDPRCIRLKAMLLTEIMDRAKAGYDTFYTGCARGMDIVFGRQVLLVKATSYPHIRLIGVVPHEGQANHWSETWRDRYFRLLEQADGVVTLSARYFMSGDGELMLTILASFAQEESRSVSDNCKWRIRKDFSEGRPMNLPLLYGYKSMQGKIAVDEEEAAVVRSVFKEYLSGVGSPRIAARLREAAIPRRFGGTWTATAVIEMLSNEKYTGDSLLQKTYTEDHLSKKTKKNRGELDRYYAENTHPAIIDHETYERAQQIMARRREEINIRKPTGARYPLTGKIVCGRCGAHYNRRTRSTGRGSIPRYTWQCLTYLSRGKRFCPAKQIPEETLNALTCEALGVEELTEIAAETLDEILVIGENSLRFVFRDGRTEEKEWAWESRSGSWTPEMRRKASERMLRRWRHE